MSGRDDKPGRSKIPEAGAPDDLLTSDDLFGEMLDSPPPPKPAAPPPTTQPAPARRNAIKVQVSEPGAAKKVPSPLAGTGATEALPEDVAALLDAFSEPGEAATRAEALDTKPAPVETPARPPAPMPAAALPSWPEPPDLDLDQLVSEAPSPPASAEELLDPAALLATEPAPVVPEVLEPEALLESVPPLDLPAPPPWSANVPEPPEIDVELELDSEPPPELKLEPAGDSVLLDSLLDAGPPEEPAPAPTPASPSPPVRRPSAQESLQELMQLQRPASRTGTKFQAATPKKDKETTAASIDLAALAAEALGPSTKSRGHSGKTGPVAPAGESARKPSASLSGDVTYGPYRLLEKVAVGGMAEVFRAKRSGVEGFEKVVAVKRILSHLSDNKEFVDMFIDEAKMVAGLAHPNIVQIFDLGKIERSYYIAMEYVRGRDLRTILRRSREKSLRIPLDLTTFVVSKVSSALEYAHRAKDESGRPMMIVHRDISPQNILIAFEGDVKLTDFGIAKAATKATTTDRGALRGKLLYMSPEQAWGKPVDRRSDIFSLGIVFYEMLTDQKPFLGNSDMSILEMVRECRVAPPSTLNPRIPEKLERVVMKALERDPEVRYQDGAEMHRDLERLLHERQPPTAAGLSRFLELLFDESERGGGSADGPGDYVEPVPRPGLEMEFDVSTATPTERRPGSGETEGPKDPMSIQKLLKRFGIK
jgi:serine/threonine protein kinase